MIPRVSRLAGFVSRLSFRSVVASQCVSLSLVISVGLGLSLFVSCLCMCLICLCWSPFCLWFAPRLVCACNMLSRIFSVCLLLPVSRLGPVGLSLPQRHWASGHNKNRHIQARGTCGDTQETNKHTQRQTNHRQRGNPPMRRGKTDLNTCRDMFAIVFPFRRARGKTYEGESGPGGLNPKPGETRGAEGPTRRATPPRENHTSEKHTHNTNKKNEETATVVQRGPSEVCAVGRQPPWSVQGRVTRSSRR